MNLTSSNPSFFSPVLHIAVVSFDPGSTGAANRAWNSFMFAGIAAAELTQNGVRGVVPAVEAVHDGAAETHGGAGFGGCVEGVVVTVQSIFVSVLSIPWSGGNCGMLIAYR